MSEKKSFIVKPHIETFQAVPRSQSIIWTVTPKGRGKSGDLQLSIIASPRLQVKQVQPSGGDTSEVQLSYFPDFVDWPTWLEQTLYKNLSLTFQSVPGEDGKSFTAVYQSAAKGARTVALDRGTKAKQITLLNDLPVDASLWARVFPPSTKVRSFEIGVDKLQIDKTAIDNLELEEHIEDIYARCGIEFTAPPPVSRMIDKEYFGPLMDEMLQMKTGPAVMDEETPDVSSDVAGQVLFNPGNGETRAMRLKVSPGGASKAALPSLFKTSVGSAYKPVFNRARLSKVQTSPFVGFKPYDFNEILSILLNYPALLRRLGLVIDLEIQDTAKTQGTFNVCIKTQGLQGESWEFHAAPQTRCVAEKNGFYAASRTGSGIAPGGMLAFNDENHYRLMQTDVVGGGFRNVQYTTVLAPLMKSRSGAAALPAERTVGIGMRMMDRVNKQRKRFETIKDLDTQCFTFDGDMVNGTGPNPPVLFADDLLRGFRPDTAVYDEGTGSWKWSSLCRRDVQYFIGDETIDCKPAKGDSPDDEGVVTTGLVKQQTEDNENETHHLLENIFRWNGWSLCVPLPSGEAFPGGECGPGAGIPEDSGSQWGLNVKTRISVACGSLPLLRFGKKYRFRARTADIAGNSLPWNSEDDTHASPEIIFRRFEPVPTPVMHEDKAFGPEFPGESLETLVIRSNYDTDREDQPTSREFYPPPTTLPLAEYHGMFDVKGSFDANEARSVVKQYIDPLKQQSQFSSKYITDPLAIGVVFKGLPGLDEPSLTCDFSSTGDKWPGNSNKLNIKIVEGSKPPERKKDEITVYLPKAEQVRISYSSLINETGLDAMAQWGRMQKYRQLIPNSSSASNLIETARSAASKGLHSMFTPKRDLLLVHAVRQPLEEPVMVPVFDPDSRKKDSMRRDPDATWSYLDGAIQVHGKSTGSVDVYGYWTEFIDDPDSDEGIKKTPVKQHVLRSEVHLDGSSSNASSGGFVNYMENPGKGALFLGTHINEAVVRPMKSRANDVKAVNPAAFELASAYDLPEMWGADRIKLVAKENSIDTAAVEAMLKSLAPRHEFIDTKHRAIIYEVGGTTRFREYFGPMRGGETARKIMAGSKAPFATKSSALPAADPAEAAFRRTGPKTTTIHVPSSARPAPVRVSYAIPTFGWEPLKEEGNKLTRTRRGNGIRVFFEGPWFSSGEDELLGAVVLRNDTRLADKWKSYVSQWGSDPIWKTAALPSDAPRAFHFKGGLETAHDLSLAEMESETQGKQGLSVIGYGITYDKNRRLWYSDIEMSPGNSYFPFVRLALARYQPYSVENAHLSAVTLSDFVQLLPDRTATVEVSRRDNVKFLRITVNGNMGNANHVFFEAALEKARDYIADDMLKWEATDFVVKTQPQEGVPTILTIPVSDDFGSGEYRLVIKEYETFSRKTEEEVMALPHEEKIMLTEEDMTGRRLVYSDVFNVNELLK